MVMRLGCTYGIGVNKFLRLIKVKPKISLTSSHEWRRRMTGMEILVRLIALIVTHSSLENPAFDRLCPRHETARVIFYPIGRQGGSIRGKSFGAIASLHSLVRSAAEMRQKKKKRELCRRRRRRRRRQTTLISNMQQASPSVPCPTFVETRYAYTS